MNIFLDEVDIQSFAPPSPRTPHSSVRMPSSHLLTHIPSLTCQLLDSWLKEGSEEGKEGRSLDEIHLEFVFFSNDFAALCCFFFFNQ